MHIIEPHFIILDELDQQSLPVRIEFCGRICYKSENRINSDSALPFVRNMIEHGHNSVLEMAVVTLVVSCSTSNPVQDLFFCQPKFLHIDQLTPRQLLITGSIRAFREMLLFYPDNNITQAIALFLARRHPYFFSGIESDTQLPPPGISVEKMPLAEVEQLAPRQCARHRHLAVKFIVSRAVTHELVRHRPCAFLQESQRYCRYSADKFGNEVTFIKPIFFDEQSKEYTIWKQSMAEMEQQYLRLLQTSTPQAARTVLPNSCKTEIITYANLMQWQHILMLRTAKNAEPSMREVMIPLQQELRSRYPAIFS
ncbi:FAD-dependent thymidylate synthase [Desulfobulbus alkaliphilus]|uniref:FAD-dependent thymidylate synthase n=1 Tax=Desulfobulbus alkaliphilus TaxID=869814 RepID=UPI0019651191|nr:FAD-dependent thymidylate synthase [Desulfobulbus alkaliphilus]MBM9537965.1 FAD-dependent thymidylate synthase [Desulfobulbus alkaliphilus]